MSVYREGFSAIEIISGHSKQIFDDAADYGMPVRKGDLLWTLVGQCVDTYRIPNTRKVYEYPNGKGITLSRTVTDRIKLIDEWAVSDGRKTLDEATEIYEISFVDCQSGKCQGMDGFITVDKIS